ncbi:MAG: class II aldolase/adducin family protein [Gammaproteobacteria bacterium]
MQNLELRKQLITTVQAFNTSGLSAGTSGNLSARIEGGFLITPTGITYATLKPDDIVGLDTQGRVTAGHKQPSSEWPFHRDLYNSRTDVCAIVHVHSPYATAIACTRKQIPAFHYMVAVAGGNSIRCAGYATFGTEKLSSNILEALQDRNACLLANHGLVAVAGDIGSAFKLAQDVEILAQQYCLSVQMGGPVILDEPEMQVNLAKFRNYGKQDGD